MKKTILSLSLFSAATALLAAATAPATSQPSDQATTAYMQAAQMGKLAVAGAPGNGRYFPPLPADTSLPTLWLIGDSTVRNGTLGDGTNMGQWGWGAPLTYYFDVKKINVVNRAFGGTSSRSFYDGFFWKDLQSRIKKGDVVILQFGANDSSAASLNGTGDETKAAPATAADRGTPVTLHTFGWYLKQFVKETQAQGATCIICSLTPRKHWSAEGVMVDPNTHVEWAAQAAKEANVPYINLHDLILRKYTPLGKAKVDTLYSPSPTEALHTGWDGAVVNAECVVSGIAALKELPLAGLLNSRGKAIAPAPAEMVALNAAEAKPAASPAK